ncbi:ParA family protein [Curtobacterium sp. VKM Ac-2887]|uniref:ParA family protein n=1 Tax=Curtobacterium sp. VKM Ac-2887 TaxID=2783819 RepID=UPI00188BD8AF|nr:ParA family protein [Curtobacterium sp. VKM Ac-2887]MBF4587964.1 ParA family protein [Curtobacterium sp. VKM Ac-2887]
MEAIMVYSESGGVSKTTTAVSLATVAAIGGRKVTLVDLDPRAAASRWIGVEPKEPGLDVGAILADPEPTGWMDEMAVPSPWHRNLSVLPSSRSVSIREGEQADYAELRLKASLEGTTADLVVFDCPNRQGGPLTLSALNASDAVVYAAKPDEDGISGVEGAMTSVQRFRDSRRLLGATDKLREAGIVVGAFRGMTVMRRIEQYALEQLGELGTVLYPLVPDRAVVQDVRATHEWYGDFRKGQPVVDAYSEILGKVVS